MGFKKNNLFQFATSELSQDAMICWIFNNYNYKADNIHLYNLAKEMSSLFLGDSNVEIAGDIKILRQFKNIDVLIVINNKYAIIIEDKTHGFEQKGQISRYKDILVNEVSEYERKSNDLPSFKEENIRTVYFKTGYHYPKDKLVEADYKMDGPQLYDLLKKFKGKSESEILTDYTIKLKSDLDSYENIEKDYLEGQIDRVLKYHYGQYILLRDMFGEMDWYSHGTSYGRPWSHHGIEVLPYENIGDRSVDREFTVFCRIDRNKSGYYVSLRQYDKIDKKDMNLVGVKKAAFYRLRDIFEETCMEIDGLRSEGGEKRYKLGGNNGGYYESEFGVFYLGEDDDQIALNEFADISKEFLPIFKEKLEIYFTSLIN